MKQYITIEQLDELPKDARRKLDSWYYYKYTESMVEGTMWEGSSETDLLSIGQRIEYLGDDWYTHVMLQNEEDLKQFLVTKNEVLCDALWEAVKEVLMET
jgi:hypothetical protein